MTPRDRQPVIDTAGRLLACAVAMVIALALASCSAHREIHRASETYATAGDSAVTAMKRESRAEGWWQMAEECDPAILKLRADSVVKPDGTVIHSPTIEAKTAGRRITASGGYLSAEADSLRSETTATKVAQTAEETADRRDTVTVTEPSSYWGWLSLALILAIAAWLWHRHRSA